MILIVSDILHRMEKLGQPELKEKFRQRGLKTVEFGLADRDLMDLHREMGPQPFVVLEALWETGFYECRWLALLALTPRDIDRPLVERWGADLEDRAQAQHLARLISVYNFVPRRLPSWLASAQPGLVRLAEEWLWERVRQAETSRSALQDLQRVFPKVQKYFLDPASGRPGPLGMKVLGLLNNGAGSEGFTIRKQMDRDKKPN